MCLGTDQVSGTLKGATGFRQEIHPPPPIGFSTKRAGVKMSNSLSMAHLLRFVGFFYVAALVGVIGCNAARAQPPEGCDRDPGPQALDFSQPPNIDHFKRQLLH